MWKATALVLIPLLGLIAGYVLGKVTAEEREQGTRYFSMLRKALLIVLALLLFSTTLWNWMTGVLLLVGGLTGYLIKLHYLYLGSAVMIALSQSLEMKVTILSLAFLYGLPYGAQLTTKEPVKVICHDMVLYTLPLLLLLTPISTSYVQAFIAGALFLST